MPYVQSINGHKYILQAVFQEGLEGDWKMAGCNVFKLDGTPMGFWDYYDMPLDLSYNLKKYAIKMRAQAPWQEKRIRRPSDLTVKTR